MYQLMIKVRTYVNSIGGTRRHVRDKKRAKDREGLMEKSRFE